MRRILIAIVVLFFLAACAGWFHHTPLVITIEAQSLPITRTLTWDANAASDGVLNYVVTQDGVDIGSPTGVTQPFTITALGTHTFTVKAINLWGESPTGTLTVNVVLPGKPANVRIQ